MSMFNEPYACHDCGGEFRGLSFWTRCDRCSKRASEVRLAKLQRGRPFTINSLGGACPTQADGRLRDGRPYYFRARHGSWTLDVGLDPSWPVRYSRWPEHDYDAVLVAQGADESGGWMEDDEVLAILDEHLGRA